MKARIKKMVFLPLALMLAIGMAIPAVAATVSVNGENVQLGAEPVAESGMTLLPIRFVTEAMGANVEWNGQTSEVTIANNNATIVLTIGSSAMTVTRAGATETVNLDIAPRIIDGRTFVPVNAIVEALGATISSTDSTIAINVEGGVATAPTTPAEVEAPTAGGDIWNVLDFYTDLLNMQVAVSNYLSFSTDFGNLMARMDAITEVSNLIMATDYSSIDSMRVKANGLADIAGRFGINIDEFRHLL
ncbi:MAG: copper amine oxidase N-terminal domain-containing protein [Defluviitaleaceae bacterium]|nr:copper amine oxidase N-terminal domain-containing protein [Defluviitaleaceae bacterium]